MRVDVQVSASGLEWLSCLLHGLSEGTKSRHCRRWGQKTYTMFDSKSAHGRIRAFSFRASKACDTSNARLKFARSGSSHEHCKNPTGLHLPRCVAIPR